MSSEPLVSVIMIFLDAEKFVVEAIESVIAQTYSNWELLLVDDGSTDKSTQIAQNYARKFSEKVRYLEHENHQNLGMSASRNLGLDHAQGEYIAFLDADDVFLAPKLEKQVAILEARPEAAMVYGATLHWYSWTGREADKKRDTYRKLGVPPNTLVQPPHLLNLFLQNKAQTPGTCGVLVRHRVIQEVGGFEAEFKGMFEDQAGFFKIWLQYPVFVEGGSWDYYRQHDDSCRSRAVQNGLYSPYTPNPALGSFLKWLQGYLREQQVRNDKLDRTLNHALWPYRSPLHYRLARLLYWLRKTK